ncbi:hypothetical protein [Ligilactobacillus agilis]|uniref:hypothetical protein n=1 Tax=Ligilactobacillus agilis TaxID=1601 RepID=UPI000B8D826B|nr:hypothetical protein [Ligilactobacillus agilis]ASR40587.1 hypothetical protein BEN83_03365 [Ligilactobacillus agilis]
MTNEEKLKKQLQITTLALARILGKTFDLVYMIEEADVDKRNAFDDLVDWITKTSAKAQKALELVEEEYKEASNER